MDKKELEDELMRIRTTEHNAAHALDVLIQEIERLLRIFDEDPLTVELRRAVDWAKENKEPRYVTREMALDAGDPSLEGQPLYEQ